MEFTKKKAKVNLSPFRVDPDLKGRVSAVSLQTNKSYSEVMTYLVELGIDAHLKDTVKNSTPYTEENFPVADGAAIKKPKKTPAKKFVAPSVQDVALHMREKGAEPTQALDEAEKFVNYWSDVDWKRKNTKMKDWKGSASNWLKNNYGAKAVVNQSGFLNNDSQIIDGHVVAPQQAGFLTHESE